MEPCTKLKSTCWVLASVIGFTLNPNPKPKPYYKVSCQKTSRGLSLIPRY